MYLNAAQESETPRLGQATPSEKVEGIVSLFGRMSPKAAAITGGILTVGGVLSAYGGIRFGYMKRKFLKKGAPQYLFDVGAWSIPMSIVVGASISLAGLILLGQGILLSKLDETTRNLESKKNV